MFQVFSYIPKVTLINQTYRSLPAGWRRSASQVWRTGRARARAQPDPLPASRAGILHRPTPRCPSWPRQTDRERERDTSAQRGGQDRWWRQVQSDTPDHVTQSCYITALEVVSAEIWENKVLDVIQKNKYKGVLEFTKSETDVQLVCLMFSTSNH